MFHASEKCPNCHGTNLIRMTQTGEYKPGECVNCRFDRSAELPSEPVKGRKAAKE